MSSPLSCRPRLSILALALSLTFSQQAAAGNFRWTGSTNDQWETSGNWDWDGFAPPGPADTATFDLLAAPVARLSTTTSINMLVLGGASVGRLNITGSLTTGAALIANSSGSTGELTVSGNGAAFVVSGGALTLGQAGTGTLTVQNAASASSSAGSVYIGGAPGGNGNLILQTGGSFDAGTSLLYVGFGGSGNVGITEGQLHSDGARLGDGLGSVGEVSLTGVGSSWTNAGWLDVGGGGTGTLTLTAGATASTNGAAVASTAGTSSSIGVSGINSMLTINGAFSFYLGLYGNATLTLGTGAAISSGETLISRYSTSTSSATVTGGTWTTGRLIMGGDPFDVLSTGGTATLIVQASGTLNTADAWLGAVDGGTGTVNLNDASWVASDRISVGFGGSGILSLTNGAVVSSTGGLVGHLASGDGTVTVSGAGSAWHNSGVLYVGNEGEGALTVSAGAAVTSTDGYVGVANGAQGEAVITTGASWINSGDLLVGQSGGAVGEVTVSGGGSLSSLQNILGDLAGSQGTLTVTGAGSTMTASSDFNVGRFGSGILSINAGGQASGNRIFIANENGSSGEAVVSGSNSQWTSTNKLHVGLGGSGELTVADGGTVSATELGIATQAGSTGVLNVGANAVSAPQLAGVLDSPAIVFGAGNGTLNFNHSGDYSLAAALTGNGTVNQLSGNTIFSGNSLAFAGNTTISGGVLTVGGSLGGTLQVSSGGTLSGVGTVGSTTVASGGTIAPGDTTGELMVNGDLVLASGSIYRVQATTTGADRISVSGNASLAGNLNVIAGSSSYVPGTQYVILSTGGTLSGLFASVASNFNFMNPVVTYSGNAVYLTLNAIEETSVSSWTGLASSDWNNAANWGWDGVVPAAGSNATIDVASGTRMPVLDGSGAVETLIVGATATGGLTVNGALASGTLVAGNGMGSSGEIAASGSGASIQNSSVLILGNSGTGRLNVSGGATVTSAGLVSLGVESGGSGVIDVSGGARLEADSGLRVGSRGSGVLVVRDGGQVRASSVELGQFASGRASATISGMGSTLASIGTLHVGGVGQAALTVVDGGKVSTPRLEIAAQSGATAVVNVGAAAGSAPHGAGWLDTASIVFGAGSGTLNFNHNADYTLAAALSGRGNVRQLGGNTTLSGDSSAFTGTTTMSGGRLRVDGTLGGALNVIAGGTLSGSGTVGNTTVASGGTLAPDALGGMLRVNGNLALEAGSTYRVQTTAEGESDRLVVTGNAELAGVLSIRAGMSKYAASTQYTILSAGGLVSGTFDTVISDFAFVTPSLNYEAQTVELTLTPNGASYTSVSQTSNESGVAEALKSAALSTGTSSEFDQALMRINTLSAGQARAAFNSMSGRAHLGLGTLGVLSSTMQTLGRRTIGDIGNSGAGGSGFAYAGGEPVLLATSTHADTASDASVGLQLWPKRRDRGLWAQLLGGHGNTRSDGNAVGYKSDTSGVLLGADSKLNDRTAVGLAYQYGDTRLDYASAGHDDARVRGHQLAAYGSHVVDDWRLQAIAAYGWNAYSTDRDITIGEASSRARAEYDGRELGVFLEAAYRIDRGNHVLEPALSLQNVVLKQDGFREKGAGALGLEADSQTTRSLVSMLGGRLQLPLAQTGLSAELRAFWRRQWADRGSEMEVAFQGAPGSSFRVTGVSQERDSAVVGLGLKGRTSDSLSLELDYNLGVDRRQTQHTLIAGLRYTW